MPPLPAIPGLPIPTGAPGYTPPGSTPAPATTPKVAGVPAGLDPKAFILTKAIAYQENGGKTPNYTAKGGSGEFGAYQYTNDTWNARAAKYLGANAPTLTAATPDQQNQVTYDWVADKLAQGFTPAQVASMHNAGEGAPNAYEGNAGTNSYGVKYDTKQYTAGVQKYAEQLYSGLDPAAAAQEPVPGNGPGTPEAPPQTGIQKVLGDIGSLTQSSPTDNGLTAGLKAGANLIPSAFNFAKSALGALNPITTLGNIASIPQAFADALKANQGNLGATVGAAASDLPNQLYKGFVPQSTRDVIDAGAGFAQHPDQILPTLSNLGTGPAQATPYTPGIDDKIADASSLMTNDPFGQTAPLVFGAEGLAKGVDAATGAAARGTMADYVKNISDNVERGVPVPRGTGTNFGGALDTAISTAASPITRAANVFGRSAPGTVGAASDAATTAAGKVIQGTSDEAGTAARVLSQVDTKGVKTYEDLSNALGGSIEANLKKVDAAHDANPKPIKLADLTQSAKSTVGDKTVTAKINYVKEALAQMKQHYTAIRDVQGAARIEALTRKAKTTGLTSSEVNALAREHGQKLNGYNANGQLASGITKQAAENIRQGLKTTARGLLEDKTAQTLDKHVSDMIRVKGLVDTMAKKVNKLEQRVVKRNVVEKVARGLGQAFDFVTFGGPKAFVQKLFFPSNVGLKTLNSIDLENQLRTNLKNIRGFENASDDTFASGIIKAARAVNALPSTNIGRVSVFGNRASAPVR